MERLLRTMDVAQMMGISVESVRRFADIGLLRCTKSTLGQRKFAEDDVIELLEKGSIKDSLKALKHHINIDLTGFGEVEDEKKEEPVQEPSMGSAEFFDDLIEQSKAQKEKELEELLKMEEMTE